MNSLTHFRYELHSDGGVVVWFDVAGRSVNVLYESVFDDLEKLLKALDSICSPESPCLIRSAKSSGFGAGADLKRIAAMTSPEEANSFLKRGQELFDRLADVTYPVIALVDGVCLGGVLEFALACQYRIAIPSSRFQIGMPETKLGLIPGWGGTQRLPRLVGTERALTMLVDGEALGADEAEKIGLIDAQIADALEASKPRELYARSKDSRLQKKCGHPKSEYCSFDIGAWCQQQIAARSPSLSPAQLAVIEAVRVGQAESFQAGLDAERNQFFPLLQSPVVREALARFTNKSSKSV